MAREDIAVHSVEMGATSAVASVVKLVKQQIVARDGQIRRRFSA